METGAGLALAEAVGIVAAPVLAGLAHAFIFVRAAAFGEDFAGTLDHAQWEPYSYCASYVRTMRGLGPLDGPNSQQGAAAARHDLAALIQRNPRVTEAALHQAASQQADGVLYGSIFNRVEHTWRSSLVAAAEGAPGAPNMMRRVADESVDAMRPGGFGYERHAAANPMH